MRTCPNCRYELRPGHTSCPMCLTELGAPVRRPRAPRVVAALLVAAAALGVGSALARRGGPRGRGSSAFLAPCPRRAPSAAMPKKTYPKPPAGRLDPAREHTWVLETSEGTIEVALDVRRAPRTTASVAFLSCEGFYDGLVFHRVVPGFVIQGGDPAGTGAGGPGYTVVEAPPRGLVYREGVVAMAKRLDEPPGASGSQFFIVSGPAAAQLEPVYALVGRVRSGMDVVRRIEGARQPVRIVRAAVT